MVFLDGIAIQGLRKGGGVLLVPERIDLPHLMSKSMEIRWRASSGE
jgi:hypothetical protein